ncbi:MAG: hypothetical protein A2802_01875 [Candidatus Woykebacteria bacterium RIFCSPHIGHO2_01_FULL_43_29]|nr:MAG: hypothetical protein A2802_01875 [Candidatus Woykebacteria bacterium RIFCSPHIGHO2_01_FULL_43_29]
MNFIRKNLYLILGAVLIIGATYFAANPPKPSSIFAPTLGGQKLNVVTQKISYGELKPEETVTIEIVSEGQTALDLLSKTKSIEVKESSYGKLVESIEGVKNNTDGKYWLYYINDQPASVGAGEYQLKPNDKIEWKFQSGE